MTLVRITPLARTRTQCLAHAAIVMCAVSTSPLFLGRAHGSGPAEAERATTIDLQGEIDLARLIELASERLGVSIQYQAKDVSQRITLRIRDAVTSDELWRILTATLEGQGLAVVASEQPTLFRVIPLAQAAAQNQRLDVIGGANDVAQPIDRASFVSVVVRLSGADPAEIASALQPTLTPQVGSVKPLSGGLLLIADVRRRVEQSLRLLEILDRPDPVITSIVSLTQVSARECAATAMQVMAAKTAGSTIGGGKAAPTPNAVQLVPLADDQRVLVVAPASRVDEARALLAELDVRPQVETRPYSAPGVATEDLAKLVRELLAAARGPARSGEDPARIFSDPVSGAVLLTASEREHARVADLIARMAASPPSSRQTMRSFVIRNRSAAELQSTLEGLLAAGFAPPPGDGESAGVPAGARPRAQSSPSSAAPGATPGPAPGAPGSSRAPASQPSSSAGSIAQGGYGSMRTLEGDARLTFTLDQATNTLIAIGEPGLLDKLERLIADLDRRQPQVMLEVTLVSLSEGDALDIGVELRTQFERGGTTVNLSSLFGLAAAGPLGAGTGFTGSIINLPDFQALVRAVESVNRGRTVSVPKTLVNNNATATLRSVAREPFTSINASDTVATTSFGGTQDAGTTITVTPQIAEGDHLLLTYAIELSAFTGESTTTQDGGVIPPPSQQNTLDGQVTIPDGFVVALGGIENVMNSTGSTRVPLIGQIPILGLLFGSTGVTDTTSRFYVFIRATVLRDPGFADLRMLSAPDLERGGVADGAPTLRPLWIE